jgi:hypothetical protein
MMIIIMYNIFARIFKVFIYIVCTREYREREKKNLFRDFHGHGCFRLPGI